MSSCDAWIRTKSDQAAYDAGHRPDIAAADRVRSFLAKHLRHSKGQFAGKPFELLPWQWEDIVKPLYGWKRPDGSRRFRLVDVFIPKKNGKSTLAAGLLLYHLVADQEAGPECYCAASNREQADIVFREAAAMVRASPALARRLNVRDSFKTVRFPGRNGLLKALSADVGSKEGVNASLTVIDELHIHKTPDLYYTLRYAGAARRQPLIFTISTAGYDRQSLCYERYEYAKRIISGEVVDLMTLAVVYEAGDGDPWDAPGTWAKANPSLGYTLSNDDFAAEAQEAKSSAVLLNKFLRYRLNRWTEQDVRWLDVSRWDACGVAGWQPPGRDCFGALDLSSTADLTAFSLCFPGPGGTYGFKSWFWVPEDAVLRGRDRRNQERYGRFAEQGRLILQPGGTVEYDPIVDFVADACRKYRVHQVGIDPWNCAYPAAQLVRRGVNVVKFRQGYHSLNAPAKEYEKIILAGKMIHDQCPVMRWQVGNVAVETDPAGNIKPSKKRSLEKIDGVVSQVMALGLAIADARNDSVYNRKGLEVF